MVAETLFFFLIFNVNFVSGEIKTTDFVRYDAMAGKACSNVVVTGEGVSNVQCAALCGQDDGCKSVFYKPITMSCTGCDSIYRVHDVSSLPDDADTVYYSPYAFYGQNCSDDEKPCIEQQNVCFPGLEVCVCDPAANYDPATGSCVTGCSAYGSTYQEYPRYAVIGFDTEIQYGQDNLTACFEHCQGITAFTCYGLDYDFISNICYYNSENADTQPAVWLPSAVLDNYMRNCA